MLGYPYMGSGYLTWFPVLLVPRTIKSIRLFVPCLSNTERGPLLGGRSATHKEDHKLYF
jgi:hypothetical protein